MFDLKWDARTTRTAATWLATTVKKPLLKLTDEDYNEHGLQELLSHRGSSYDINIEVFKAMQSTNHRLAGWEAGLGFDPSQSARFFQSLRTRAPRSHRIRPH